MLLGMALQHKTVDELEKEIDLPSSQLLGLFNRLIRKVVQVNLHLLYTCIIQVSTILKLLVMIFPKFVKMLYHLKEFFKINFFKRIS